MKRGRRVWWHGFATHTAIASISMDTATLKSRRIGCYGGCASGRAHGGRHRIWHSDSDSTYKTFVLMNRIIQLLRSPESLDMIAPLSQLKGEGSPRLNLPQHEKGMAELVNPILASLLLNMARNAAGPCLRPPDGGLTQRFAADITPIM